MEHTPRFDTPDQDAIFYPPWQYGMSSFPREELSVIPREEYSNIPRRRKPRVFSQYFLGFSNYQMYYIPLYQYQRRDKHEHKLNK